MEKGCSSANRASDVYGMGLLRSTSFGRKRVSLSRFNIGFGEDYDCIAETSAMDFGENYDCISEDYDWIAETSPKRRCSRDSNFRGEKSALEGLPEDLLSLVAKKSHFAYTTPRKTVGFQKTEYFEEVIEDEAPNAPKQYRIPRRRLSAKKLADISVALFASAD